MYTTRNEGCWKCCQRWSEWKWFCCNCGDHYHHKEEWYCHNCGDECRPNKCDNCCHPRCEACTMEENISSGVMRPIEQCPLDQSAQGTFYTWSQTATANGMIGSGLCMALSATFLNSVSKLWASSLLLSIFTSLFTFLTPDTPLRKIDETQSVTWIVISILLFVVATATFSMNLIILVARIMTLEVSVTWIFIIIGNLVVMGCAAYMGSTAEEVFLVWLPLSCSFTGILSRVGSCCKPGRRKSYYRRTLDLDLGPDEKVCHGYMGSSRFV